VILLAHCRVVNMLPSSIAGVQLGRASRFNIWSRV